MRFHELCECKEEVVNNHDLKVHVLKEEEFDTACEMVATIVPEHYETPEQVVRILALFGKPAAANYLRGKLPEEKKIRSGDFGEIMATEFINECTSFNAPIKRLRWKDHRNMALRGDDVIGITVPDDGSSIEFLKSEVKSRLSLVPKAVRDAREALNNDGGLPSPHALSFVSDRLRDIGQPELADAILRAQLIDGISEQQVQHLLFTISGNTPDACLKADLENYAGAIEQNSVGVHITKHQEFIATVFEKVEANHEP